MSDSNRYSITEAVFADIYDEVLPLLRMHYEELGAHQDIPLLIDYSRYKKMNEDGVVRIYTIRDIELVGYAAFIVSRNAHYSTSLQALQDVLYIHPDHRRLGAGRELLALCDKELKTLGVQVIIHHVKIKHPALGLVLLESGYELSEMMYEKRI